MDWTRLTPASLRNEPMTDSPTHPFPRLGVSGLITYQDQILLAKRGKAPAKGYWSLPGGSVERGESLLQAIRREIMEETAIQVAEAKFMELVEIIHADYHYVIAVYMARLTAFQNGQAGDDAAEIGWFSLDEIDTLDREKAITMGTAKRIRRLLETP